MLEFKNTSISNLESAIRGMRNSFDSWEKSDSYVKKGEVFIGKKDLILAKKLVLAGSSHRKFLRQIFVSVDLTMPLYFAKQLDTYKIGIVRNSTSTMHTLAKEPIKLDQFSFSKDKDSYVYISGTLAMCERLRKSYNITKDKKYWRMLIQLLPSGFNQISTMTFNYENLRNIYFDRRYHRLEEWKEFCDWILSLPYAKELITYEGEKKDGT